MVSHLHASKIVVFYDPEYPQFCTEATLHRLIPGPFEMVGATDLAEHLERECSLLLSFHGSYFPKAAWRSLLRFLETGGNLAIFGGMPFICPVNEDGTIEPEQDSYTRQIHLGPYLPLSPTADDLQFVIDEAAVLLRDCPWQISADAPGKFWSFYPMLTQASDHPEDMGSSGPIDTVLQPLVYALGTTKAGKKQRLATPLVILDQRAGRFKGGRWLLSPWQPASEEDWLVNAWAIQRLITFTAQSATMFAVRPALACYQPGETPALIASTRTTVELQAHISIHSPDRTAVLQTIELTFAPSPVLQERSYKLPSLPPGLYCIEAEYWPTGGQRLALTGGFWVWDETLVENTRNKRLTAGRDYFYQDNQLFLVYGTTYMDSLVQRKFLQLPNPARWDRDLAEMKAAGINLVRTGIWTAWRELVPIVGIANEAFLRALDAFVLTACKHNIQVIFTFFSFFPPLFEGENPWLDPRSVEAQQNFVALLASRYARVELLSWDLINEPSFGNPRRIFSQRPIPNYDRYEVAAFQQWLMQRYTLNELQLRWRLTPADIPHWSSVLPPHESDYNTQVRETTVRPMFKVADFTLFSQDMFNRWAEQMVEAIRASGGQTLVGVGQDESASRIAPQFYASSVDYTTTHPWWNVDDLLWDMLLDKTPNKPNLIQETGVMQLRDLDGRPWHSEQANAYLLERKLITGLMARGAGVIQWLWHTNNYMVNENENSIGLVRADGSAKPELAVMEELGRLTLALAERLLEMPLSPDIWVVIPYAQWFARPDLARHGTQQAVRVLGYDLGIIPQLISEYQLHVLNDTRHQPRTIIVPAVQLLHQQSWQALLTYAHGGGTVLINGLIGRDSHGLDFNPGLNGVARESAPVPVSRYEELTDLEGHISLVTFADEKMSYVRKAHNRVQSMRCGTGNLVWCGLPLELSNETSALRNLYTTVINPLNARPGTINPVITSRLPIQNGTLILAVSEASHDQCIVLDGGLEITIEPGRAGALILETDRTAQTFGGVHLCVKD